MLWKPCRLERDRSLRPGRGASSDSGQGLFLPGENRRRRRGARALAGSMAARPLGAIRRQAVSSLSSLFGSLRPEGDVRWATLTLTAIIGGRGTLDGRLVPSECLGRKTYGRYASGSTKRVGSAIRALFDLAIDSKLRRCGLVRVRIGDLVTGDAIRERALVIQRKTSRPVHRRCAGARRGDQV